MIIIILLIIIISDWWISARYPYCNIVDVSMWCRGWSEWSLIDNSLKAVIEEVTKQSLQFAANHRGRFPNGAQQSTLQLPELRYTKAPSLCCTQWTQASSLVFEQPLCWSACWWWGQPGTRSPLRHLHPDPGYMGEAFFTFRSKGFTMSSTIVLSSSSSLALDATTQFIENLRRLTCSEIWQETSLKGTLGKLEFYERILWIGTHFVLSCKQTKLSIPVSMPALALRVTCVTLLLN